MRRRADAELRAAYGDLLTEGREDTLRLVGELDAGLKAVEPPPALWSFVPRHGCVQRRKPKRLPLAGLVVFPALLVLLAGIALALSNLTNLGRPTNATGPAQGPHKPLGNYRHVGISVRSHGKPVLLFIGTQADQYSAAEAWPVVKALEQFGTFANVRAITSRSCTEVVNNGIMCAPPNSPGYLLDPSAPTFDWDHATYRSRYVGFVHYDLIDHTLHLLPRLPATEAALFNRYVRPLNLVTNSWHDAVFHAAMYPPSGGRGFPLVQIGGYLNTAANYAGPGDLVPTTAVWPLPFATIQRSLQRGHAVGKAPPTLVTDFNAEANLLTALICHADHGRPKTVCGRKPIRTILKHVK